MYVWYDMMCVCVCVDCSGEIIVCISETAW